MEAKEALRDCGLFSSVDEAALGALADAAEMIELRGGDTLFEAGSPSDALFLVLTGRLRARSDAGVLGEIGVLESAGEIGIVADEPRLATVVAVRDSQLLRLDREALLDILLAYPRALLSLSRVIIERLRYSTRERQRGSLGLRSLALVVAAPVAGQAPCVDALIAALAPTGRVRRLAAADIDQALGPGASDTLFDDGERNRELSSWLHEAEMRSDLLVYVADGAPGPWLRRCVRQADRLLVLGDAGVEAPHNAVVDEILAMERGAEIDVLLRNEGQGGLKTLSWLQRFAADAHYYWRPGHPEDLAPVARQLTGRGVGLVLGGGGARGFAHIGLVKALEHLQLPVDLVGGSSMGAFMAALFAKGLNAGEMTEVTRETFVSRNYLNDYMLPRVALIRGRRFLSRLEEIFGATRIEDLARPLFCVSSDLTSGSAVVHETGPLAIWVGTSMSVPGVAPPVAWKEHLLADGGVVNSLPTDVMLEKGRGPILASNVSTAGPVSAPGVFEPDPGVLMHWKSEAPRPNLLDILFRTATLTSESGTRARAECADVYLRMPVKEFGLFDWELIDTIVEAGYRHAMEVLEAERGKLEAPERSEPLT